MNRLPLISAIVSISLGLAGGAGAAHINEFVANDPSIDDHEFIELCGVPGEVLDGQTILLIEGETSAGTIDRVIPLDGFSLDADGYFVVGDPAVSPDLEMTTNFIENGGNNILLVSGFTGSQGDDIDVTNDCLVTSGVDIGTILNGIGYGLEEDCRTYFGIPAIGPDIFYDPAGGALCQNCDYIAGQWLMICLDGAEPGGNDCLQPEYWIEYATPGEDNPCAPMAADRRTWGALKSTYR